MAVYTSVSHAELDTFLSDFDLGTLVSHQGIDGGIENTNYFVTLKTDQGNSRVCTYFI
ncbi:hypothetical protein [Aliamphritea spongicola]|nr:hypothetical protein [Aliamphritea spongicola]